MQNLAVTLNLIEDREKVNQALFLILTHGNNTIISNWPRTFQNIFFCVCHCLQGRLGEPGEPGPKGFQVSYWA